MTYVSSDLHDADDVNVAVLGTASQVADGDEVVGDGGDVSGVLGQLHHAVVLEGELVLVVELGVLLVGVLHRAVVDVEHLPDDSLVEELVALLLEGRHPDLPRVVHEVHGEELPRSRRLVPGLDVGLAGDPEHEGHYTDNDRTRRALPGLDGPLVLVGSDAADGRHVVLLTGGCRPRGQH